jgi:MoxR-like ATPase
MALGRNQTGTATLINRRNKMIKLNPEQTARAIVLCIKANLPVAVWCKPGTGKSSIIAQIAKRLGWKLHDVRLGDKETSDFAIPYPVDGKLEYLMTDLLPFEGAGDDEEKSIILLDEYDRAKMAVQNMSLQITLDRKVFGRNLKKNARIVLAGNQCTDIGTNQLSEASATRMVHIYMETESEAALQAWDGWAEEAGITPEMRAFAQYRKDVWNGPEGGEMIEMGPSISRPTIFARHSLRVVSEPRARMNSWAGSKSGNMPRRKKRS